MKTLFFLALIHLVCAGNSEIADRGNNSIVSHETTVKHHYYADTVSLNGQWYLQPLLAADTAAGKFPMLKIDLRAGTFLGNTGCNTMRGRFQKTDSSFAFDQNIMTTKMFCAGYDEVAFLRALQRTNHYKIENGELVFLFDTTELSRWTRKPDRKIKIKKA